MKTRKELQQHFYQLIKEYRLKIILSIILIIISSLSITYIPKLAGQTVNLYVDDKVTVLYEIVFNIVLIIILSCIGYLLKLPTSKMMIIIGEKVAYKLRIDLYNNLTNAQLKNIYSNTSGNIMGRINNDLMNVRTFITGSLSEYLAQLLTIIFALILIISTDIRLSLVYLFITPLYILIIYYIIHKSKNKYKNHQNEMGHMIGFIGDSIANHIAIKAYSSEDYFEEKYDKINLRINKNYFSSRFQTSLIQPITQMLTNLINIGLYIYGAYLLINNEILIGTLLTVILYGQILTKPLKNISKIVNIIETSLASLDRILEITEAPKIKSTGNIKLEKSKVKGNIEFKNICYKNILNNFNLKINSNEITCLTGKTCSDKSILMELLLRLYPPDSGEIFLDEYNINDINPNYYKDIFGYVPQNKWIFEDSIAKNIGYGLDNYNIKDIEEISKLTGFNKIIERYPEKYNTIISEEKNSLSEGEKELICISRALIRNPKIIILDDIKTDITEIIKGKTVIIITQNKKIMEKCDKIIELT